MFKVKILTPGCQPTKAYEGDAGFDVYNAMNIYTTIGPGERSKIPLGIAIEMPQGYMGVIQGKSGMAAEKGITTIGNIIDCGYRGEIHAILLNTSQSVITLEPRQKVAQLIIVPCYTDYVFEIVDELSDSTRKSKGFGSTGL